MTDVDPRFEPEFQRGYDPAVHRVSRRAKTPRPEPVIEVVHVPESDEEYEREALPSRRNPFLVVLPILGLVFLTSAVLLIARLADAYKVMISGPMSSDTTAWASIATSLMPASVVGCVVSFTVWFALLAVIPRRADA